MRFITYLDILMWEFAYDGTSDGLVSSNDGTSQLYNQCDYYIDCKSLVSEIDFQQYRVRLVSNRLCK